ncbi:MAG: N-6 DNA methylase [Symploca sp. SIO2E6]|nr:N-6 DNA methylase [Symploca sp. SIO2E6]
MLFTSYIQSIQSNLQRGSERTHYPALKNLLDNLTAGINAVIEEKGNKAGIPDFTVRRRELLVGYVEAKDVGLDLTQIEKTEQLQRYRESLNGNLLLTNYLEFRWYVDGKLRLKAVLAEQVGGEIQLKDTVKVTELIEAFLNHKGAVISSPEDLAKQMARLTKSIRLATEETLKAETQAGELHQLKRGFNEILLPDLDDPAFADMYAQSISYGLFAARVGHAQDLGNQPFNRCTAGTYIPATNPFLKRLFNTIVQTDLIGQINWAIDDLVQLLAMVNMSSILENFGRRTRTEDPVVHFYETYLAAYDKALRKSRGVYYTPEPVVSFIVRSVDAILKERFNLPLGLADNSKDSVTQQPRVQILDPATGTGTFLYGVVNQIYQNLEAMEMAGSWNQYVQENLLGRLYGFELLMAPYAIAHLKLGLQLQDLGYQFSGKQRLGIYLTNTLDEALKKSEVLFGQFVAQEANEASAIKRDVPVMVVLGNPPYAYESRNTGEWISGLIRDYYQIDGEPLGERNPKGLQDDYVKFIRFFQWRIEQTGYGVLAFVTNHGYLDNPTFRGMRQSLMQSFTDIYILDLHGNAKKKETCPDGSPDQNIFDIQQGVSIGIFIKEHKKASLAQVHHAELWGNRSVKYEILTCDDVNRIKWTDIAPLSPDYLFTKQNTEFKADYDRGWQVSDIFQFQSMGITSGDDGFLYDFSVKELKEKIDNALRETKVIQADKTLLRTQRWAARIINKDWKLSLYRPFDQRAILYCPYILERAREKLANQFKEQNIGLITIRRTRERANTQFFVTEIIADKSIISSVDNANIFPLYQYPDTESEQGNLLRDLPESDRFTSPTPNLSSDFLNAIREKLGYIPTPEAIFYYAYAIFHNPTYRQRYAEFLKIDFPRLPLTSNDELFQALGKKGQELVELHLMKSTKLNQIITKYPVSGDNAVTQVTYKPSQQRVYINKQQYFEGIASDVWTFKIGGYQVLDKWLKDRKKAKRSLSFDDVLHYQRVIVVLKETMQLMTEIDQLIPSWPLE